MKTHRVKIKYLVKNNLLILVLLLGFCQLGISQRKLIETKEEEKVEMLTTTIPKPEHSVKITPIKALLFQRINVVYENHLYKDIYVSGEVQGWFMTRDPLSLFSEGISINKGIRMAIGVRSYSSKKGKPTAFYLGLSMFYGSHKLREERSGVSNLFTSSSLVNRAGNIKLTSQGFKLSMGFRRTFKTGLFIEGGFDFGGAWTNQKKDSLTLFPEERTDGTREASFNGLISGQFSEPVLSIGYSF